MKRFFSFFLAMVILLGSVPVSSVHVHAAEAEDTLPVSTEETSATEPESVPQQTEETVISEELPIEEETVEATASTVNSTSNAAQQVLGSGTCGSSINWTLYDSGLLEITGSGSMYSWTGASSVPWTGYQEQITEVTIADGITTIGEQAFTGCSALTKVSLPDSITHIGTGAFQYCSALSGITLPSELTYIGQSAFNRSGLTSVGIPGNVSNIGSYAFSSCPNLREITVSGNNTTYKSQYGVLFNADMTTLYQYPGAKVAVTNGVSGAYTVPEGVENIWEGAFYACTNVTDVIFPESLKYIGQSAFTDCTNLIKLELPGKLWKIDKFAFLRDEFAYIKIRTGLSTVADYAFSNATVGAVYYEGTETQWSSISFGTYNTVVQNNSNLYYRAFGSCGDAVEYEIRDGVLTISGEGAMTDYAAYTDVPWYVNKAKITAVVVEDGVTTIGDYAFYNHEQLNSVSIGKDVQVIGKDAFNYCNLNGLSQIVLPEGLTTIKNNAFWGCTQLTSMTIPASVTSIGASAFKYCDRLATITFKGDFPGMASDGEQFYNLPALQVYYPANNTTWTSDVLLNYGCRRSVTWTATCGGTHVYDDEVVYTWAEDNSTCTAANTCTNTGCEVGTKQTVTVSVNTVAATCGEDGSIAYVATFTAEGFETQSKYETLPATGEHTFGEDGFCTVCGAGETVASGTCGDNLTWTLNVNGVLTISGTGDMTNYTSEDYAPWYDYSGSITTVVVGEGVTGVGNYAFRGCGQIVNVFLADSVTSIGARAFWNCTSLQSINIPEGVSTIYAYTFSGCSSLTSIALPSTLTTIAERAFYSCGLTDITIPDSVLEIGNYAFYSSDLQTVTIGKGVSTLYAQAFAFCSNLKTVTFTGDAPRAGESNVFRKSSGKVTVYYPAGNDTWTDSARSVIESVSANWVSYCMEHDFSLPVYTWAEDHSSCTAVMTCANGCTDVTGDTETVTATTQVTDPSCVTEGSAVYTAAFTTVGFETQTYTEAIPATGIHSFDETTHQCECGLIGGTCGENLTWTLDGTLFTVSGTGAMIDYPNQTAPWYELYRARVKTIVIEEGVTTIGSEAFYDFTGLTGITIPSTVTGIGSYAFNNCTSLAAIDLPAGLTSLGSKAFYCCTSLTSLVIPEGVTAINMETFGYCRKLETITLPTNLKSIGQHAFNHCESLKTLDIPDTCTSIEDYAFMYCAALTDIHLPENLPSVGYAAFYGCTSLEEITIPDTVMSIGERAFEDCTALKEITVPNGVYSIAWNTFCGCSSLTKVVLSENLMSLDMSAFSNCGALTELTVPASVTSVVHDGWEDSQDSLNKITFLGDAPTFVEDAFTAITATCYYYTDAEGWTEDVLQNHGGEITWVGQCRTHVFDETTHQCECGLIGGKCGDNADWTLVDGVFTVSGTGATYDYGFEGTPWYELYRRNVTSVVVEGGITYLGDYIFSGFYFAKSAVLPDTLTAVGDWAFRDCSALAQITLPESITDLSGESIFYGCKALTSIIMPAGVTALGSGTFLNCAALAEVVLPEGLTSIGDSAFSGCTALTAITLPETLTTIGAWVFQNSGMQSIVIPNSVTAMGEAVFYDVATLTDITLSGNLKTIPNELFWNCVNLEQITIPDSVTAIGANAFAQTGLTEVEIPASVTQLAGNAFGYCEQLSRIHFLGDAPVIAESAFANITAECIYYADAEGWTEETKLDYGGTITWLASCGDHVYEDAPAYTWADGNTTCTASWNCQNAGCEVYKTAAETVTSTVETIDATCQESGSITYTAAFTTEGYETQTKVIEIPASGHAFDDSHVCTNCGLIGGSYTNNNGDVHNWTLIDNVLTVTGTGSMAYFGENGAPWYGYLGQITDAVISEGITSVGGYAFQGCQRLASVTLADSVTSISYSAFYGCISLKNIELPAGVTTIQTSAFRGCTGLESIVIPEGVTTIGNGAFMDCSKLSRVVLPEGLTFIDSHAFRNCESLVDISLPETLTELCYGTFWGCSSLESIVIPDGITTIGNYAFCSCTKLSQVNLPDTVISIGDFAFASCVNLEEITLPESLASLGRSAFKYCSNLESINIPNGVVSIGDNTFYGCSNLTKVTLPENLMTIGDQAFHSCKNLVDITLPENLTSIGESTFAGCTSLESIAIPGGVAAIEQSTFSSCSKLTYVTLSEGLTSIGNSAFGSCGNLVEINLPGTLTSIGEYAFSGCSSLETIAIPEGVTAIGTKTFYECSGLTQVTLPESLTSIGEYAFYKCSSLEAIAIPGGVTVIEPYAFKLSKLTQVTLSEGLTTIGDEAFEYCSFTEITFPGTLTSIGWYTFSYCEELSSITFTGDAPTINAGAFAGISTWGGEIGYVTANCYYPLGNETWTEDMLLDYGGELTWLASCGDHVYEDAPAYTWADGNTTCTASWNCQNEGCEAAKANETVNPTVVNSPATCTQDGSITYTAEFTTEGLQTQTRVITIPASGHNYEAVVTEPTCTEAGSTTYTCANCSDSYTEAGEDMLGHALGEWETVSEATCTEDGERFRECSRCGYSETETVAAGGHDYTAVVTEPTCTEAGSTTYTCANCNDSYTEAGEAMLGHDWSKWKITANATCTADGELRRDCSRCGSYEAEAIEATGHTYETEQTEPTCTEDGVMTYTCTVCGHSYTETTEEMLGHDLGKWSITKMATCTEEGELRRTCSRCDYFEAEPIATIEHAYVAAVTEPTCTEQGYTTHTCSVCGDSYTDTYVDALGHSWDEGVVTVEPTAETEGELTYTCGTCGETRTESIPVLEPEYQVTYTSASISLAGDIGMNYYAVLSESLAAAEGAYIQFSVAGSTQKVPVSAAEISIDAEGVTTHRFTCKVAAKQMTDTIVGQMYLADGTAVGEAKSYSVKAYCDAAIPVYSQYAAYANLVNLMEAMLNYGAYSQLQLGYNTANLANADLADTSLPTITEANVAAYAHGATGSESGISVSSVSLLLESNTTIRFYFQLDGTKTIDQYTFYVDGALATPVQSAENTYYVDKVNVAAKDLDEMATVTVGGLTVQYCGLSYVRQVAVLYASYYNESLVNVAKALYAYNQAANAYFG